VQVYLNPEGFKPLSLSKSWQDITQYIVHNDISPMKSFNKLFEEWKDILKRTKEIKNFRLFMSAPVNKQGGHIHAIVLAFGAGKIGDEMIKELFIDKASRSLTSFFNQCSDNSLFCHLFNVRKCQNISLFLVNIIQSIQLKNPRVLVRSKAQ